MSHNSPEKWSERQQLERFLQTLFRSSEFVEIRAIVSPRTQGGKSRMVARMWETPEGLLSRFAELTRLNRNGANIYFGVCPRVDRGGTKQSIIECRCIWADFDRTTPQEALFRTAQVLPMPTMIVSSGHGAHLYWSLAEPWSVKSVHDAAKLEQSLKGMYADLRSDSTQDTARMLRLPGFFNQKGDPVPCTIATFNPERTYPFTDFERWIPQPDKHLDQFGLPKVEPDSSPKQPSHRVSRKGADRIRELVTRLDEPVEDRSRRDFGVVCGLVRHGLSDEQVWSLVQSHSKFAASGRAYFDKTIANARSRVQEQEISR